MKIKMIKSERGSVDGCRVQEYEAEQEYDLSATPGAVDLARAFIGAGFAKEVGAAAATAAAPVTASGEAAEPGDDASETSEPSAPSKPGRKVKAQ